MIHSPIHLQSTRRTDEALEEILTETGNWVVNGSHGQILCLAANLERALDRAADYARSDAIVVALTCLHPDKIVVHADQVARVRQRVRGRARVGMVSPAAAALAIEPGTAPPGEGISAAP